MAEAAVYRSGQAAYAGPLVRAPKSGYSGMSARQLHGKAKIEVLVAELELISLSRMLGLYTTAYRIHRQELGILVRRELQELMHETRLEIARMRQRIRVRKAQEKRWANYLRQNS